MLRSLTSSSGRAQAKEEEDITLFVRLNRLSWNPELLIFKLSNKTLSIIHSKKSSQRPKSMVNARNLGDYES